LFAASVTVSARTLDTSVIGHIPALFAIIKSYLHKKGYTRAFTCRNDEGWFNMAKKPNGKSNSSLDVAFSPLSPILCINYSKKGNP
jgi:hypothetical protein